MQRRFTVLSLAITSVPQNLERNHANERPCTSECASYCRETYESPALMCGSGYENNQLEKVPREWCAAVLHENKYHPALTVRVATYDLATCLGYGIGEF